MDGGRPISGRGPCRSRGGRAIARWADDDTGEPVNDETVAGGHGSEASEVVGQGAEPDVEVDIALTESSCLLAATLGETGDRPFDEGAAVELGAERGLGALLQVFPDEAFIGWDDEDAAADVLAGLWRNASLAEWATGAGGGLELEEPTGLVAAPGEPRGADETGWAAQGAGVEIDGEFVLRVSAAVAGTRHSGDEFRERLAAGKALLEEVMVVQRAVRVIAAEPCWTKP